jgi:hypothetical protein
MQKQLVIKSEDIKAFLNLKVDWQNLTPRFSDKELLDIFPEAKVMIPEMIKEWQEKRDQKVKSISQQLGLIRNKVKDQFSRWFWREWIKQTEIRELLEIDNHLSRLHWQLAIVQNRPLKGQITPGLIQQALAVPIENVLRQTFRRSGRNLIGLCPLHEEKHPSFFIYPETNTCWCYGCNQGGNIINLIRLMHGYSFKEAVHFLAGEN